jgi:hypothetical protein
MGTGLARAIRDRYPDAKIVFGNPKTYHDPKNNKISVHWSDVFFNNPIIVQPDEPVKDMVCVPDYPGCRIYIDYEKTEKEADGKELKYTKFAWQPDYQAVRGELYFDSNEKSAASEIALRLPNPFFIIEPHIANKPWKNKKGWPFERWQAVVDALPEVGFVQMSDGNVLDRVHHVLTPTFRQACGIVACAGAVIASEGGLHHAAAALDIPAVVLWGHYTSPDILGYDDHENIRHAEGLGCGYTWKDCPDCQESMHDIKVDEVIEAIRKVIRDGRYIHSREARDRSIFRMVGSTAEGQEK